jgi:hypothetical protein
MTAELDHSRLIDPSRTDHAHHTGWAWSPADNAFVLTLHDEDDNCFAVASYTFEHWMDTFKNLKEAHDMIVAREGGKA